MPKLLVALICQLSDLLGGEKRKREEGEEKEGKEKEGVTEIEREEIEREEIEREEIEREEKVGKEEKGVTEIERKEEVKEKEKGEKEKLPLIRILKWAGLNGLFDGEKEEKTLCSYKNRITKNRSTILINCRECEEASSLNDETCRKKIFSILLKENRADSLVLSRLYEREYEGKALSLLYALAEFREVAAPFRNLGTLFESCEISGQEKCARTRKQFFDLILENMESNPLRTCWQLTGPEAERLAFEVGTFLTVYSPECPPECRTCSESFYSFITEMRRKVRATIPLLTEINSSFTEDYEARIKPYVRPPFSTSRIYTEAPGNTEFLECYDISRGEGSVLEISLYRFTDRPEKLYLVRPPEYNLRPEDLRTLERVRKRMILHRPEDLSFADPAGARRYFRRMAREFLLEAQEEEQEEKEGLSPSLLESYADLLARYTNGLGILEDLLSDERITDVYINAPADLNPVHVVMDGEECVSNVFFSQDDLDSLVSRFRTISGRPFGEAIPVLELNLEDFGVRVSVIGDPLSANGLAYAFRKHALTPWTLPKLINTGSISAFAAGFLSFLMDGQASVLIAGEVGAGKTSLLSALLLEIPQKYRILTIEDTLELPIGDLQTLGWKVQGMSSRSSILKSGAEFSPDTALRAALRLGSSSLVLGEVRGPEVKVLYEAMQVGKAGNAVIGTIHGSSVKNVYERIVHTLGVPPASFRATDAVVVCSSIRPGGSMRRIKRVSQIAEVKNSSSEAPETDEVFTSILEYEASGDLLVPGEVLEQGQSELVEKIARKWGIPVDQALQNIDMRARMKDKIAKAGLSKPDILKAEAVSRANNMFWLLMDSEKRETEDPDFEALYTCWEEWFDAFSHGFPESQDSLKEKLCIPGNQLSENPLPEDPLPESQLSENQLSESPLPESQLSESPLPES